MSNQNSIKEGDPNESTPTKSLHELTPLRSWVAPLRCPLSSVCGGKDKKNSRYRQIFWRKNAKKNCTDAVSAAVQTFDRCQTALWITNN